MDSKTAVNLCRKYENLALSISNREFYSEIANLIEQSQHRERVLREALEKISKREIRTISLIENGETINKFSYTDTGKIAREALEASK